MGGSKPLEESSAEIRHPGHQAASDLTIPSLPSSNITNFFSFPD